MKQVIVVNESLKLPRGKLAAQVAHASVGAFLEADSNAQRDWLSEGMPKVVLACETQQDLETILALAEATAIPSMLIQDAGRTVVPEGTVTCLGLGPADDKKLVALTGQLKLVR